MILAILLGVAYFLFTSWRKAFKDEKAKPQPKAGQQRQPLPQQRPLPPRPNAPKTSFEDILRELQPKAERAGEVRKPVSEKVREQVTLADKPQKQPFSYEQQAVRKAISLEQPTGLRKKVELEVNNPDPSVKSSYINRGRALAEMLRNPQGLREAVVLSEIFNRKY